MKKKLIMTKSLKVYKEGLPYNPMSRVVGAFLFSVELWALKKLSIAGPDPLALHSF